MDYTDTSETETDTQSEYFNRSRRVTPDSESEDDFAPSTFQDGKPLQLIKLGKNSEDSLQLTLDTEALDNVLETCGDRRICIITAVGGDRTGKSFLLNCIKDNLKSREIDSETTRNARGIRPVYKGFNFKAGYKPVTKGIWIWNKAFIVEGEDREDVAVLLMDTEGINDELSKPDEIAAILGIPSLSSSIFILNLSGNLSLSQFDSLSKFVGKGKKQSNSNLYQKLSILVHDWTNISTLKLGERGGKKYFEKFFNHNYDQIAPITSSFEAVECFLLPNIGEKAIQSSFSGKSVDLSKEFSKYLQRYLSQLLNSDKLCSKKILDFEVKPQDFKQFFVAYVAFFNNPSEMDTGISSDALCTLTRNTARKIQVDRGIEEYHKMFEQRKKSSNGGFLRESTINGIHVQARKKALQASKIFSFSKEEQKKCELELDAEINKEKKDMQMDNISARKTKIRKCIDKAADELRNELDRHFPFTPEPGLQMPRNLFFYDEDDLERRVEQATENIKAEFLEEFLGDDEDELAVLEEEVDKVLKPIGYEFVQTNQQNMERALDKVQTIVDKFAEEYKTGIQKKINRLRKLDSGTLSVFHDDIVERIEQKFEGVQLGTEFKAEWWVKLLEILDGEHIKLQCNLESTMAEAMELVTGEETVYKQLLSDTSNKVVDDEEVLKFHETNKTRILEDFKAKNPFPPGSPKYQMVEETLMKTLNNAYTTLIEKGLLVKRKQQESLEKISDSNFSALGAEIEKRLKAEHFMYADECEDYLKRIYQRVINRYEKEVAECGGNLEKEFCEQEKIRFESKCKQFLDNCRKDNSDKQNQSISAAENIFEASVKIYEAEMKKKLKRFGSIEDFSEEHSKLYDEFGKTFRENLPRNKLLIDEYIQKLDHRLKEIADELRYLFDSKKKAEDFAIREAFLDCRNYYTENMDKAFNNSSVGYFTDEQFDQMNTQFRNTALQNINVDPPLNSSQVVTLKGRLDKLCTKYKEKNELIRRSHADEDVAIGIDLGTTYCCVAAFHKGKVQILRNELGSNTTPSYVCINHDGTTTVGITAKEQAFRNPEATIFDAKRMIGRRLDDEKLKEDMKFWPFSVVDDEGIAKIKVHDKLYHPEEISSLILKHLKEEAGQFLKREVKKAVITVPAYFTDGQRQATIDAGELAGLEVLAILNEPTAAAVAYRLELYDLGKPRKVLVYDLGGGTFDVAVLEISEDKLDVLSIGGDSHLGGEDFDKNLMTYCAEEYKKDKVNGFDLLEGKDSTEKTTKDDVRRRLKRLQFYCENAKKGLAISRSIESSTVITIDEIKRGHDLNLKVTRKVFDEKNQVLFDKTIKIVDEALESAKLRKEDIDDIVLVGGSTRIAKLQEMLAAHFNGRPINKQVNPDEAVAYGAAVQAAILNAKPGAKVFDFGQIQEITPMSLGIEVHNNKMGLGVMDVIIRKGVKIPCSHTGVYYTTRDNQTSVLISVFQGEDNATAKNKLLGNFSLDGIPKNEAQMEAVEVTMSINLNGILNVEAVSKSTRAKKSITISDDRGRINKKEMKKLLAEAS